MSRFNRSSTSAPTGLAERFWSVVEAGGCGDGEPRAAVVHLLAVLDKLEALAVAEECEEYTAALWAMLRQERLRGDLSYASPEQARGEPGDERSLVFSVGGLLFEKLTGRHPFGTGDNPNRLARIRSGSPALGVDSFARLPPPLRGVVRRALRPLAEDRYDTLQDFRSALGAVVEGRLATSDVETRPDAELETELQLEVQVEFEPEPDADRESPAKTDHARLHTGDGVPRSSAGHYEETEKTTVPQAPWFFATGWAVAGALAASIGFIAAGARLAHDPQTSPSRAISSPLAVEDDASGPGEWAPEPLGDERTADVRRRASQVAGAANAADARVPRPEPVEAARAERHRAKTGVRLAPEDTADFDADVAGDRALRAARGCFTKGRLEKRPAFGASLLFRAGRPESAKVYLGAAKELRPEERRCLNAALRGVSAGGAPDGDTFVVYSFFLDGADGRYLARVRR